MTEETQDYFVYFPLQGCNVEQDLVLSRFSDLFLFKQISGHEKNECACKRHQITCKYFFSWFHLGLSFRLSVGP